MSAITLKKVKSAYRKFKQYVYYDKTNLNLRSQLARFECDPGFGKKLSAVKTVVNSADPVNHPSFRGWLEEVSFRIVPKSLEKDCCPATGHDCHQGKFISNVTSAKTYPVEKVNYFFDGPIELHLIAVLWIMEEGYLLDARLRKECYGSRLEDCVGSPDDSSPRLFRKYHELYSSWRDSGIRKAKQLLVEEKKSVYILGLDVQEYYYHIRLDFEQIAECINEARSEQWEQDEEVVTSEESPSELLCCIEHICEAYKSIIADHLVLTHSYPEGWDAGIPIGFCSSPLLANWFLREFDDAVITQVRPAYYGRYLDDVLLVLAAPQTLTKEENPVADFMSRVLVEAGIIGESGDDRYEVMEPGGLYLQRGKCILQYFDADHSIAGLEKFQKKLEENTSAFMLLPVEEGDNSLEDVAYELLYDGSVNKFRSVKGMAENRFELAKHLSKQTVLYLLTDTPPNPRISRGLRQFFKGKNAIEFHDLWERVLTLFAVAGDSKAADAFVKQLNVEIKRVRFPKADSMSPILRDYLTDHLRLSREITDALCVNIPSSVDGDQVAFRQANLVRHQFVRIPLLNYADYSGSLTARYLDDEVEIDSAKLKYSPRYVNFDECMLLADSGNVDLGEQSAFEWACDLYHELNGREQECISWTMIPAKGEVAEDEN